MQCIHAGFRGFFFYMKCVGRSTNALAQVHIVYKDLQKCFMLNWIQSGDEFAGSCLLTLLVIKHQDTLKY